MKYKHYWIKSDGTIGYHDDTMIDKAGKVEECFPKPAYSWLQDRRNLLIAREIMDKTDANNSRS